MLTIIKRGSWNRAFFALKILIATGIITFLFISGKLNFAVILYSYKYPVYLFFGVLFCFLALITPIFRWWILARIQKLSMGAFAALRLTMIGYFFNLFIPGGSGGDVIRAAYTVHDYPERKAQALTIVFVDRGLGLHALLLVGVSIPFIHPTLLNNHPGLKLWILLMSGMLFVGTVVPLLLTLEKTNSFIMRLFGRTIGGFDAWHEAMKLYREQPRMISIAYFLSICSTIFNVFAIHLMMFAIGSTPTTIESFFVVPLIILANTLPFTPGGIGIAEGASTVLYALVGQAGGANGMLLTRFFIVMFALFGLPFFLIKTNVEKKNFLKLTT